MDSKVVKISTARHERKPITSGWMDKEGVPIVRALVSPMSATLRSSIGNACL